MKITLNLAPTLRQATSKDGQKTETASPTVTFNFQQNSARINNEMISTRKSAARARMAQLKQQIEAMMQFAHIGKGNPQQIARLAKELKGLVAEYGGVGAVSIPAMPAASDGTENAASTEASADQASDKAAAQTTEKTDDASKTTSDAEQTAKTAEKQASNESGKLGTEKHSGQSDEDKAFFSEAKKLAQKLKQLLALENRKLETEEDQKQLKAAKQALAELDKTIIKAEEATGSGQAPISTDTYTASGNFGSVSSESVSVHA